MTKVRLLPHVRFSPVRTKEKEGASIAPTSQQDDDDDDDDVRDVRDEVRHATIKNYFFSRHVSHQTSRDVSRETSEDGTDGSTMERAFGVLLDRAERPERRRDARVRPTPRRRRRVVSSRGNNSYRFNRRRLGVDRASRRRTPNAGTLSTDSLILPFFAFSLDAALSPPGRPTVKVRRTRTLERFVYEKSIMAHRVRFRRARSRVARRPDGGYRRRTTSGGWARRRPLWMGCRM